MQTIKFNTGRHYTSNGQRIAAALLDDGSIYFVDRDRMIDGIIVGGEFSQRGIMRAYDSGDYRWTGLETREQIYQAREELERQA